jgi:hypothetical protein
MRIGYGAAGPCSSVGKGAGPFINGTAIIAVVVVLVGPAAVDLPLLTTAAGLAGAGRSRPTTRRLPPPLAPITATRSLALLRRRTHCWEHLTFLVCEVTTTAGRPENLQVKVNAPKLATALGAVPIV